MNKRITHLGTLYTEDLNPRLREEEDRIKIFDSDGNYLDYFSTEGLQEWADYNEISLSDAFEMTFDSLQEAVDVEEFLDLLGINYEFATDNYDEFIKYTKSVGIEDIKNNEWVNHIGKTWILIAE